MRAIIDGDIAAFRAASATVKEMNWDTGEKVAVADIPVEEAVKAAHQIVRAWTRIAGCNRTVVTFTGRENFRKSILPSYKMNRSGKVKPKAYWPVVNSLMERWPTHVVEGLEADDLMGILLTTPRYSGDIVVTLDKDLRTVPGLHLHPLKETAPVLISPEEADYWWLTQVLTGDTSDGYTGIPGIGKVKALKILGEPGGLALDYWPKVVAAYVKAGLTEDDALVQARVSRILRREDYDTPKKEIILWHPTTPHRIPVLATSAS